MNQHQSWIIRLIESMWQRLSLVKHRYELAGFNTLNRLVCRVRYLVNQKLFAQVVSQLQPDYIQRLEELLDSHQVERRSPYNNLKQLPKRPTRNHLNDLVAHLSWLETLGDVKPILANITAAKIHHFAAEAKALDASEMKDFTLPKRITLLLCLIYLAGVQTRDNLALMFLKQVRKIHHKGKEELQRLHQQHQDTTEKLIGVLANLLQVFVDEPIDMEVVHRVNQVLCYRMSSAPLAKR